MRDSISGFLLLALWQFMTTTRFVGLLWLPLGLCLCWMGDEAASGDDRLTEDGDETSETAELSNKVVLKFGIPHLQQVQEPSMSRSNAS